MTSQQLLADAALDHIEVIPRCRARWSVQLSMGVPIAVALRIAHPHDHSWPGEAEQQDKVFTSIVNTQTGQMRVSAPVATTFDLVRYPEHCGFLSNVATVLNDLAELLDGGDLVRVAEIEREVACAQRLGNLLELVGGPRRPDRSQTGSRAKAPRIVPLDPTQAMTGARRNLRWRLAVNDEVEPDQGIA